MPSTKNDSMRGLAVFISDIRNCKSREAEIKRVNKELANIRSKFKGDRVLDGYSKKKYVCKLLFIFLLGNDVNFGYMEAVNLMTSNRYSEKQIGYLFVSIMIKPDSDLIQLIIQNVKADLHCNNPVFQNLALQCLSSNCNNEIAELFIAPVTKMLTAPDTIDELSQSAALTLLNLIRHDPAKFNKSKSILVRRIPDLLHHNNLFDRLFGQSRPPINERVNITDYITALSGTCRAMTSTRLFHLFEIVSSCASDFQDYTYYHVAAPWLCVKLLKILQNFTYPSHPQDKIKLNEALQSILIRSQDIPKSKKIQQVNARNAVLFEAIQLIVHYDCEASDLVRSANLLGQFLQHRDTNMRYLAIGTLCLLSSSETARSGIQAHIDVVTDLLKNERDLSVRQKALDLLYAMCNKNNSERIVSEMLSYVNVAGYQLKEELVLKIAILAEKYPISCKWYVDTMLGLIQAAGDFVADEVWHRVIQVVVNHEDVQQYAAQLSFDSLQEEPCYETTIQTCAYILGEYGHLIAKQPRSSPDKQLKSLHSRFFQSARSTRCLLLSTYLKLANNHAPQLKSKIESIFDQNIRSDDVELQQRAVEYLNICKNCPTELLSTIAEMIPCFTDKVPNPLHRLTSKRLDIGQSKSSSLDTFKNPFGKTEAVKTSYEDAPLVDLGNEPIDLRQLVITPTSYSNLPEIPTSICIKSFSMRNSGTLYEDATLLIRFKDQYSETKGQITISMTNKSEFAIGELVFADLKFDSLAIDESCPNVVPPSLIWIKSFPRNIDRNHKVEGVVGVQTLGPFMGSTTCQFSFKSENKTKSISLPLPVMLNKFSIPAPMDKSTFSMRWNSMSGPGQEAFQLNAVNQIDASLDELKIWIQSFGWSTMEDTETRNLYGGGIVNMGEQLQSGVLYRLDIVDQGKAEKSYKLNVRSAKIGIARLMAGLFYW